MRYSIQATPAYELSVDLRRTGYGHHLSLISFVPLARRPEQQVRFQAVLSTQEMRALRDAIDDVLTRAGPYEAAMQDDPTPGPPRCGSRAHDRIRPKPR